MKYHVDVHMPQGLRTLAAAYLRGYARSFRTTSHVRDRAVEKGFILPSCLPQSAVLIEVTVEGGSFAKALFRASYDSRTDICFALTRDGFVPTAWFNAKDDNHKTLDVSQYVNGGCQ